MIHTFREFKFVAYFFLIIPLTLSYAFGQAPSHDPTPIQEDSGRYWIFTTGVGIWHMSATNTEFTDWRSEDGIFPNNEWPEWINTYVPGFQGTFWAPGIIQMNGKWHVYYSCSTFGSQTSAIGLVTATSLEAADWEDQGMVVYSNSNRQGELGVDVNAIDADVMRDRDGRVWMLYGSYWNGIVITELDTTTGKPIDPTDLTLVANGNPEAGALISHGDYYYLFFNRGACCRGINSYYHILMGRSQNPNGPFYDKDSVMTHQGGGSLFIHSDGRYVGPGHFGYGQDRLTYHYYDGQANGAARLKVGDIEWGEDDWPTAVYTRAGAVTDGEYVLINRNSSKALQMANGATASGTNVEQSTETGDTLQHWRFTYAGDGYYEISPVLAPDKSLEIAGCSTANGGNAQIGDSTGADCQLWYVARMGSYYRVMSKNSRMALEIESAFTTDGANARQWPFNEHPTQQWSIIAPREVEIDLPLSVNHLNENVVRLYPNPTKSSFTIEFLDEQPVRNAVQVQIFSLDGKAIFDCSFSANAEITIDEPFEAGIYQVRIDDGSRTEIRRLVIN